LDGSGNNKTLRPFANLYSVIPSAEVIFSGMGNEAAVAATAGCLVGVFEAAGFCWAHVNVNELTKTSPERSIFFMVLIEC
jgi:hypothetical protein